MTTSKSKKTAKSKAPGKPSHQAHAHAPIGTRVPLRGDWAVGHDRATGVPSPVPGLFDDPAAPSPGPLWYRHELRLPAGDWSHATLELKGARFRPAVYVNGQEVSRCPGGMAPTVHRLASPAVKPGAEITLEIELQSLSAVPPDEASYIAKADHWRSNLSSGLWDDAVLHLHGAARIAAVMPDRDPDTGRARLWWRIEPDDAVADTALHLRARVLDADDAPVATGEQPAAARAGVLDLTETQPLTPWSPDDPALYRVEVELMRGDDTLDRWSAPLGFRRMTVEGTRFRLNGRPFGLRAGTVVWHRWCRDPEARALAFDHDWFERHVVGYLKEYGANTLRFHLGTPPEALLDLCDRHGLAVQAEWLFFHGLPAAADSLRAQWRDWLELCLRHPCVVLIHPWNETEDADGGRRAFDAIAALEPALPPFVLSHRDVIHAHRYWWSLFENLGLDYDSADQFSLPIMADEFGGNYLDGAGDPGRYPTVKPSLLRFLGHGHTVTERLELQRDANARVAEYWRRIGVAGFSPFCLLGSPEDGNHHYLGELEQGVAKPVWDALVAAWAPVSCTMELWDRNFFPGQRLRVPLDLYNDTPAPAAMRVEVLLQDLSGHQTTRVVGGIARRLPAFSRERHEVEFVLPDRAGDWFIQAWLAEGSVVAEHPVLSFWEVRTLTPRLDLPADATVHVLDGDPELRDLIQRGGGALCDASARTALWVGGAATWAALTASPARLAALEDHLRAGGSAVLLDVGPRDDGHRELPVGGQDPTIQGPKLPAPRRLTATLPGGVTLIFTERPEAESNIHPPPETRAPWNGLDPAATRLWNGLRGGMIVPAWDMAAEGLSPEGFLAVWQARGADPAAIRGNACVAHELGGLYAFGAGDDAATVTGLRERVRFLMDDAPALAASLNPDGPVRTTDLGRAFREAQGAARAIGVLACAGMGLVRAPVIEIAFAPGWGRLILSQLYTAGRLGAARPATVDYAIRPDPAAQHFVANLLRHALRKESAP